MTDKSSASPMSLRHTWKFLVAEMVAIVFGVFLGVWISELAEDREIEDFVASSRDVMRQELASNFDRIMAARDYHIGLLPTVIDARDQLRANDVPERVAYRGFGAPLVTTAAYDTALSAGVFARVDPVEAAQFSYAYEQIENMRSVMADYRLAIATSDREFYALVGAAFGDSLYAEDAALRAIATITAQDAPNVWTTQIDVRPY